MPKTKTASRKPATQRIFFTVPTWMTEVTPASKALAMTIFIALPFIAFWMGVKLQRELMGSYPPVEIIVRKGCAAPMQYIQDADAKRRASSFMEFPEENTDGRMY